MNLALMERQEECFVSGSLATVLRISRCVGMAPLKFHKEEDGWRISMSRSGTIISLSFMFIIHIIVCWDLACFFQREFSTTRNVSITDLSTTLGLAGTIVYGAPKHLRCLITSLNQVQKINSELNIHHWSTPWTRKNIILLTLWAFTCFGLAVSMYTTLIYLNLYILPEELSHNGFQIIVHNVCCVVLYAYHVLIKLGVLQFSQLALHVRSSFSIVNDRLRDLLRDMTQKHKPNINKNYEQPSNSRNINYDEITIYSETTTVNFPYKTVHRVASAYSAACEVVRDVNHTFGLTVMVQLGAMFMKLVFTLYFYLLYIFKAPADADAVSTIFYNMTLFSWFLIETANLIIFVEPCHLTYAEMARTRVLVSQLKLCAYSVHDPFMVELQLFCSQLTINDDISYSPLYVVSMTRELVLAMMGSITSYLVILLE